MPVCPELSEGGGDVCLRGGAGAGALPLKLCQFFGSFGHDMRKIAVLGLLGQT